MKLYTLAAQEDGRCFSPYCWRGQMALVHKGLSYETIPWRSTEKHMIAFSGRDKIPVLEDGEQTISGSWTIATYLETTYHDQPSLFGGIEALALTQVVNAWIDRILVPVITPLILSDILVHVHERDRDYFRQSRVQLFGKPVEDRAVDRNCEVLVLRRMLEPFRKIMRDRPYFFGDHPMYADYVLFGVFQWARCVSPFRLVDDNDPIAAWRHRMFDLYDGMGLQAKGYPV